MATSLADFVVIGPRTFLYTPPKPRPGQLIILCTWLGAARKHIAKYTALYRHVAPDARILLIESSVSILTSTIVSQRRMTEFAPAAAAVLDALAECGHRSSHSPENPVNGRRDNEDAILQTNQLPSSSSLARPQILLHIFSNGGMSSTTNLLRILRSRMSEPLALTGLIFDSCPGKGASYWQTFNAIMVSFPNSIAWRFFGALITHCFLIFLVVYAASGHENPETLWRRTPLEESRPARGALYLFSREDRMIDWMDIKQHAQEAETKGWRVNEIQFEGSGHCAHLVTDERRYVEAVKSIWEGNGGGHEILSI